MGTGVQTKVFVSYARKDGGDVAQRLRETLTAVGCNVWLDAERIEGGSSWSKAIERALNDCQVLVAVLTEGAYVSEICRAEQIWALEQGKQVIPVLAAMGAPRPIHLSALNYRIFPSDALLADIQGRPGPASLALLRKYDTVPALPQNFIAREKALAELRDLLFSEGEETNIAVTAVAGMGGIGKSVLAAALCRDAAVQRAFPDGIAWITVGREWDGDFVPRMREVGKALGDDLSGYDSALGCENRYRHILREKAALVVLDDVWNLEHLKRLLVDAPRSRFLFTTRDAGIAKAVTKRRFAAELLEDEEARSLLARSADVEVSKLPGEAAAIVGRCGRLAIAVAQIGASLREVSPAEWRDMLDALENVDIGAIESLLPTGQESFFRSLAVSLQAIPPQMQERYGRLAFLLEDMAAPLLLLRTLWNVSEAEARRTARFLVERSLAVWDVEDDPKRGIRLHDLQLDYLWAKYPNQEALDLIHGAIRLSEHVIYGAPEQFAPQVTGRLLPYRNLEAVSAFLTEIGQGAAGPWLRPVHPALHPPGTALLRTLEGHADGVRGVAVTADGKLAISASRDKTLKVWALESGRLLRTMEGHADSVNSVALTPDGRRAVSASRDQTVKVWDPKSGLLLFSLEGHSDSVNDVAITAAGDRAVSASRDRTVKLWDLEKCCLVKTLMGHAGSVLSVRFALDGRRAVSGSSDFTLKLWDLDSGETLRTLEGHNSAVVGVAVAADGRRAVSGSNNGLRAWDLASGLELPLMDGARSGIFDVAMTADGKRAVCASSWNLTLRVWDLERRQLLSVLEGHSERVASVAMTDDGLRAISGSSDRTVKVWDLRKHASLHALEGHADLVSGVGMTADGTQAVSGSSAGDLKVWDVRSGRVLRTMAGRANRIAGLAVSADGKLAVCASADHVLELWDLVTGRLLRTLEGHSAPVRGVAMTADLGWIVSASADSTLKIWSLESGRPIRTLEGHSAVPVGCVTIAGESNVAVSGSEDCTLRLWDLRTGNLLRTLAGHSATVKGVAVTKDGKKAISASSDKTLIIWDLSSQKVLQTLTGHTDSVTGVTIDAESGTIFSASWDNTLKAWDPESGICLATFRCDALVSCCAFAHGTVVAGDAFGRVHFLRLEKRF